MYILRGDLPEDQLKKAVSDYQAPFKGQVKVEEWGKRRLAFPMKHVADGYYVLMTLSAEAKAVKEMENRMRLDGNVLRYLVVRLEDAPATVAAAAS